MQFQIISNRDDTEKGGKCDVTKQLEILLKKILIYILLSIATIKYHFRQLAPKMVLKGCLQLLGMLLRPCKSGREMYPKQWRLKNPQEP